MTIVKLFISAHILMKYTSWLQKGSKSYNLNKTFSTKKVNVCNTNIKNFRKYVHVSQFTNLHKEIFISVLTYSNILSTKKEHFAIVNILLFVKVLIIEGKVWNNDDDGAVMEHYFNYNDMISFNDDDSSHKKW